MLSYTYKHKHYCNNKLCYEEIMTKKTPQHLFSLLNKAFFDRISK